MMAHVVQRSTAEAWDEAASGWHRNTALIHDWLRDATQRLLDAAHIEPVAKVLDVAAGAGYQTHDIVRRVGNHGDVWVTDISPHILALAQDSLRNVKGVQLHFRVADAQALGMAGANFDAAVCRLGLMFCPSPLAALGEVDGFPTPHCFSPIIERNTPLAGVVETLAGTAGQAGSTDATTGAAARFNGPSGVALDSAGNVYVADFGNHTIRKITSAGAVTTLAGTAGQPGSMGAEARFASPIGVAVDIGGIVYVVDRANHTIRRISSSGLVTTLAGMAGQPGSTDAKGAAARFDNPTGVALDSAGNVYVADSGNHTIRKITASGAGRPSERAA